MKSEQEMKWWREKALGIHCGNPRQSGKSDAQWELYKNIAPSSGGVIVDEASDISINGNFNATGSIKINSNTNKDKKMNKRQEKELSDYNHQLEILINKVEAWGLSIDLYRNATSDTQWNKGMEEIGEVFSGHNRGDKELVMDGLGDVYVCYINHMALMRGKIDLEVEQSSRFPLNFIHDGFKSQGYHKILEAIADMYDTTLLECLQIAYDEIKDRKGKFIDGVFIKESDLK
jgi:hypothetical protein